MSDLNSPQKIVSLSSDFVGELFSAIKCFFVLFGLDLFSNVYVEERESQHAPCILHHDNFSAGWANYALNARCTVRLVIMMSSMSNSKSCGVG